ncbi:cytochrome d ubiquinol oxidase subunit II [Nocardioides sp. TRM66260-LWL]|uniref:cytochrome d ubiquinol oxidase subunit II n=1 Tax=Nocardioides sp. TRM66260-LWL TaxID=2874478 RepID=UPI001CC7F53C|nr:cytochrome d ubiquinol oxidase subunit II [Nocardioides sp. TRM66260-LWL]MBZ5736018.1 cytochrome d ubiquinol oxidase subunit II [Nocardioides sp. TRM66260-LWL]
MSPDTLAVLVAAALFTGVLAYGVLGGADFGSGLYDLMAGDARRGAALRTRVDHSLGPVWEANHVWLVFVLVVWWTGFPRAFAAAMDTLAIPLALALLGIVLRGSTFAFRKHAEGLRQARLLGAVFALSSVLTPFFLGTVAGAIASGRVPLDERGDRVAAWVNPTSLVGGVVAVGTCAFLGGVFLTADAVRSQETALAVWLRRRTLAVGVVTGALVFAGLLPLRADAPVLWAGLTGRALPLVVVAALAGLATLGLLASGRTSLARVPAVLAVVAVLSGWGVGQYPYLLVDHATLVQAAGAPATLAALLIAVGIAAVVVLPALGMLLWFAQTDHRDDHRHGRHHVDRPEAGDATQAGTASASAIARRTASA